LTCGEKAYKFLDTKEELFTSVAMGAPDRDEKTQISLFPLLHPVTKQPCPVHIVMGGQEHLKPCKSDKNR
jgi:adenine-specific DNA-methyltransferase